MPAAIWFCIKLMKNLHNFLNSSSTVNGLLYKHQWVKITSKNQIAVVRTQRYLVYLFVWVPQSIMPANRSSNLSRPISKIWDCQCIWMIPTWRGGISVDSSSGEILIHSQESHNFAMCFQSMEFIIAFSTTHMHWHHYRKICIHSLYKSITLRKITRG